MLNHIYIRRRSTVDVVTATFTDYGAAVSTRLFMGRRILSLRVAAGVVRHNMFGIRYSILISNVGQKLVLLLKIINDIQVDGIHYPSFVSAYVHGLDDGLKTDHDLQHRAGLAHRLTSNERSFAYR